jgi:hypothetical protein
MSEQTYPGGCQCGQLRFVATGEPANVRVCHCRQCQRATGAPFYARALYLQSKVAIEGRMTAFSSSDRITRAACPDCGGLAFSIRKDGEYMGVALAAFDVDPGFVPTDHMWLVDKAPWVVLPDDGAARWERFAP